MNVSVIGEKRVFISLAMIYLLFSVAFAEAGIVAEHLMTIRNGLTQPSDVAVHRSGRVYLLDGVNGRVNVFDKSGSPEFTLGQAGKGDGELNMPMGIEVEGDLLFIADTNNHRIAVFKRNGTFVKNIDLKGLSSGQGMPEPAALLIDENFAVWSDRRNHQVCRTDLKSGKTLNCWGGKGEGEGSFLYPFMLDADRDGYLYVTDVLNGRVQYFNRKGGYYGPLSGFGFAAGAFSRPSGIAVASDDRVYVADSYTGRVTIFRNGKYESLLSDKGGREFKFDIPMGMTLFKDRLYVVDMGKESVEVFRLSVGKRNDMVNGSDGGSAGKNCVTCHLSWSPDYRQDERDKGSPVLPEVSPRLCYSCHNGGVIDSRKAMAGRHQHPDIDHELKTEEKDRPRKDKIPAGFPLLAKERLYCGTCHTPHNKGERVEKGGGEKGVNRWMRVADNDGGLCAACHSDINTIDKKEARKKGVHPVNIELEKSIKFGNREVKRITCMTCHSVHDGSEKTALLIKDEEMQDNEFSVDRRNLLIGAGALGIGTLAAAIGSGPFANVAYAAEGKREAHINAIYGCIKAGNACISHCLDSFKTGDTAMADCAASVTEMLAFCEAHARMASLDSKYLKDMSQLAIKICGDCEKECRKHEKHQPCKACAEACADCIRECKRIIS